MPPRFSLTLQNPRFPSFTRQVRGHSSQRTTPPSSGVKKRESFVPIKPRRAIWARADLTGTKRDAPEKRHSPVLHKPRNLRLLTSPRSGTAEQIRLRKRGEDGFDEMGSLMVFGHAKGIRYQAPGNKPFLNCNSGLIDGQGKRSPGSKLP